MSVSQEKAALINTLKAEEAPGAALSAGAQQNKASDPAVSAWVEASAGSGKTKVLVDRVLRLLLPQPDGTPGAPAHRILCITFTRAGASEMAMRLSTHLARWAVIPELPYKDEVTGVQQKGLAQELSVYYGRAPARAEIEAARRLFARVIEAPGGLQIMTIHSFCQSLLGRFPLEAGIPPHFELLEEAAALRLQAQALERLQQEIAGEIASPDAQSLAFLAAQINEKELRFLLQGFVAEQSQLEGLIKGAFGLEGLLHAVYNDLALRPEAQEADFMHDLAPQRDLLLAVAKAFGEAGKTETATTLTDFVTAEPSERLSNFEHYRKIFLTGENIRANLLPTIKNKSEWMSEAMAAEAVRVAGVSERFRALQTARTSAALLRLGHRFLKIYQSLKDVRGVLDYTDLVLRALELLRRDGMQGWVQYKLDQGLQHILVDEAQDTNPEQWEIIRLLSESFFHGEGAHSENRTIFVVGDEKQSIYSFQRASPQHFFAMKAHFARRALEARKAWEGHLPLKASFRTVPAVLRLIDAVFSQPDYRLTAESAGPLVHDPNRRRQGGEVTVWPLLLPPVKADYDYWEAPLAVQAAASPKVLVAEHLAGRLEAMIGKEFLPSRGRFVQPEDVLILLRKRGGIDNLMEHIARALKNRNIPVAGMDRLVPRAHIGVQDLLAIASFCLFPLDDLSLACALKSPFLGLDEETLYDLSHNRAQSLWASLRNAGSPQTRDITVWIESLQHIATDSSAHDFFQHVLDLPCPADPQGSGWQALQSRLGVDAHEPVQALLSAAAAHAKSGAPSLQQFLQAYRNSESEIRRENSEAGGFVRVMTIHGAKGLQAPVVILPDAAQGPGKGGHGGDKLLWPQKSGLKAPLWTPRAEMACDVFRAAQTRMAEEAEAEEKRLLYVALTRAEDRLYIGGVDQGGSAKDKDSWYVRVRRALEGLEAAQHNSDGSLTYKEEQSGEPDRQQTARKDAETDLALPDWVFKPAPPEDPRRLLHPSRLAAPLQAEIAARDAALSPLRGDEEFRFLRGNLTHRLLQFLPDLPQHQREKAAQQFLNHYAHRLLPQLQGDIVRETMLVLNDDRFGPVFGPGSIAEMSITGVAEDGRIISGQIDRVLITSDEIFVLDYKTNRPAPRDPALMPPAYRAQLALYAEVLRRIYPGRRVSCALLWTDGAILMPVSV